MKSPKEIEAEIQDLKILIENKIKPDNSTVGPEQSRVLDKIKTLEWVLGIKDMP